MTKAFETTIDRIKGFDLPNLKEEAIKQGVILPLLNRAGWATEDITEVCPEFPVGANSGDKVDYSLRIGETNHVFVEAKAGHKSDLLKEETQVTRYCCAAKPSLAVLTNGSQWRLYLPPQRPRSKNASLRLFLEFDVTDASIETREFERSFRRFLDRERMSTPQSVKQTVEDARALFKESQNVAAANQKMAEAVEQMAPDTVAELLAAQTGVELSQAIDFVKKQGVKLAAGTSQSNGKGKGGKSPKPVSFTFQAEGEDTVGPIPVKSAWSLILVELCLLMQQCHPEKFVEALRAMPSDWFTETPPNSGNWPKPIGNTGFYVCNVGKDGIKQRCGAVLKGFGYPLSALTIEMGNGEVITL